MKLLPLAAVLWVFSQTILAQPLADQALPASPLSSYVARVATLEALAREAVPREIAPQAKSSPLPPAPDPAKLKDQRVVEVDGRKVTFQRLESAPDLPAASHRAAPAPVPVPAVPNEEKQKAHETLFISATVYDHALSELRWFREGREFRVFVNFDFTVFRGTGRLESDRTVYSLVLGIGESSWDQAIAKQKEIESRLGPLDEARKLPPLSFVTSPDIRVLTPDSPAGDIAHTPEYQALPDLLKYYTTHENDLRWRQAVHKAENAARQRWHEANPPPPRGPATIQFWPAQSRTYQPATTPGTVTK